MNSLSKLIVDTLGLTRNTEEHKEVFTHCISYITKGISAFEFQDRVRQFCHNVSAKVFRLKLLSTKYVYFTIKLAVLKMAKFRSIDKPTMLEIAEEYGLGKSDTKTLYQVWNASVKFRARVKKIAREFGKNVEFSTSFFDEQFKQIYEPVMKHIKYMTYSKLRFIVKSTNEEYCEFHSNMMLRVLQAYYQLVPTRESLAYVINYLKRAATNHAQNIIKSATSKKGGRLSQDQGLLIVSENQLNVRTDNGDLMSYDEVYAEDHSDKIDMTYSVGQILNRYRSRTKKYNLLTILMGNEDAEFTRWLQARKLCSQLEDNTDLQMRVEPKTFNKYVSEYLHVNETKLNVFLLSVARKLALSTSGDGNDYTALHAAA